MTTTQQKSKLEEYTKLSREISQLESELAAVQAERAQLKQQIGVYYEQLKAEFGIRWPPLKIKQV